MARHEDIKINKLRVTELYQGAGRGTLVPALGGLTATADEINKAADVSGRLQTIAASGAITAGVQSVELNHADNIAATIATSVAHPGLFIAKAILEPTGSGHTITLTAGTWDGSNTVATFADILDTLVVYFDSAGDGTIIENVGAVVLS